MKTKFKAIKHTAMVAPRVINHKNIAYHERLECNITHSFLSCRFDKFYMTLLSAKEDRLFLNGCGLTQHQGGYLWRAPASFENPPNGNSCENSQRSKVHEDSGAKIITTSLFLKNSNSNHFISISKPLFFAFKHALGG